MQDTKVLAALIEAHSQPGSMELREKGIKVGKLYTDHGLPIDMALEQPPFKDLTNVQKVMVLDGACNWFVEHKRNSGANDKAIERQRTQNQKILADFIKTGETGIY